MEIRAWTPKEHPRLFFGKKDLQNLREKRSADDIPRAAWSRIQEDIKKGMSVDLPRPRDADRWEWDTGCDNHKNMGMTLTECGTAMNRLSFSWLLDGNESHARKATDILMKLFDFDFWTSLRFFGTDYRLPWRGTLETAGMCRSVAWGYDCLYDFMSETERHRVRTCLLYKGILPLVQDWADPLTRLPLSTHILPWGNWWQFCVTSAGEAVMAIYGEHPLTERFARLCREASDWFFRFEEASVPDMPEELLTAGDVPGVYYPPNFDSGGGYWEGLHYMDGVLSSSFSFAESYRRQTGEEILPMELMRKVVELILNEGQIKRLEGKLVEDVGVPGLSFVLGDAMAPYEGRLSKFLRGMLFVGGEYYVVTDWLEKQNDKPFKWLLHYDGEMTRRPEGCFIKKAKANLLVNVIEPADYQLTVRQGYKTYHEDLGIVKSTEEKQKELERGDYMEITPTHNMNQQNFLTILYPFGEDGNVPKIEKIVTENWTGVRVARNHEVDLIGLSRDGIKDGIKDGTGTGQNGVKTDAKLFCITMDKCGTPVRALMQSGTYLKFDGRLLASSPEPATIVV